MVAGYPTASQGAHKELTRKAQSEVSTARKRKLQVETELEALAHAILVEEVLKNI